MEDSSRSAADKLILFVAEGFGSGRVAVAPGTFGTLAGFLWIYLLLLPENIWFYLGGTVLGCLLAVWFGSQGERILDVKDPGSIVIDEIAALPVAFLGGVLALRDGAHTPPLPYYFALHHLATLAMAFIGFRVFDIWKPWIIRRSQYLPRGWGLAMDDVLAALPVIPLTFLTERIL